MVRLTGIGAGMDVPGGKLDSDPHAACLAAGCQRLAFLAGFGEIVGALDEHRSIILENGTEPRRRIGEAGAAPGPRCGSAPRPARNAGENGSRSAARSGSAPRPARAAAPADREPARARPRAATRGRGG